MMIGPLIRIQLPGKPVTQEKSQTNKQTNERTNKNIKRKFLRFVFSAFFTREGRVKYFPGSLRLPKWIVGSVYCITKKWRQTKSALLCGELLFLLPLEPTRTVSKTCLGIQRSFLLLLCRYVVWKGLWSVKLEGLLPCVKKCKGCFVWLSLVRELLFAFDLR